MGPQVSKVLTRSKHEPSMLIFELGLKADGLCDPQPFVIRIVETSKVEGKTNNMYVCMT